MSLPPFPLPVGPWDFNGNGFKGVLDISSLDPQGNFKGSIQIPNEVNTVLEGHYDEISQKIMFLRKTHPDDLDIKWIQSYIGLQFFGCSSSRYVQLSSRIFC